MGLFDFFKKGGKKSSSISTAQQKTYKLAIKASDAEKAEKFYSEFSDTIKSVVLMNDYGLWIGAEWWWTYRDKMSYPVANSILLSTTVKKFPHKVYNLVFGASLFRVLSLTYNHQYPFATAAQGVFANRFFEDGIMFYVRYRIYWNPGVAEYLDKKFTEEERVFIMPFEKGFSKMFALQLSARQLEKYDKFVTYRESSFASWEASKTISLFYQVDHKFVPHIILPREHALSEQTFVALSHYLASDYLWEVL